MTRLATLLLALGVYTGALAASQGPTPSPAVGAQSQQNAAPAQHAKTDQRQPGTDQHPVVVKLTNTGQTQEERAQDRQGIQDQASIDREIFLATAALATCTGILVVIGLLQLWLFFVQLDHIKKGTKISQAAAEAATLSANVSNNTQLESRDFTKRELRAYVFVHEGHITNIANPLAHGVAAPGGLTNPAVGPMMHIEIQNSGKTPAYNVHHWGTLEPAPHPLGGHTLTPRNPRFAIQRFDMASGGIASKGVTFFRPLTPPEIAELHAGTQAIYVHGFIEYTDVFGEKHRTDYRASYNSVHGPIGTHTDLTFSEDGNSAT